MKGQTKTKKSPGSARLLLARNVKQLMDAHFADSANKPKSLANEAALSLSSIQRVLAGDVGASIDTMEALATVFGLTVPELLGAAKSDVRAHVTLIEDYQSLPEGWKYFIRRKAKDLREVADTLPSFLKEGLRAIPDESTYWQWENELNAYIRQQKGIAENDAYVGQEPHQKEASRTETRHGKQSSHDANWENRLRNAGHTIQEPAKPYGTKKRK
ncbi:MAG TPA: helix-turn-helix domain-containing protein [Rhodocyclaceae bacterium]|nr:helix-turn-helix domain-containing protein [Rhodocyclaceae bacterium]